MVFLIKYRYMNHSYTKGSIYVPFVNTWICFSVQTKLQNAFTLCCLNDSHKDCVRISWMIKVEEAGVEVEVKGQEAQFPGAELENPLSTPGNFHGSHLNGIENPKFKGSSKPDKLHAEGLAQDLDFYGTNEGLTLFDGKNDKDAPLQTEETAD